MMRALWFIARHEVVRALRNSTLRAAGLLFGALLFVATLLGAHRHATQARERQAHQELVRRQWEEQPARHPELKEWMLREHGVQRVDALPKVPLSRRGA